MSTVTLVGGPATFQMLDVHDRVETVHVTHVNCGCRWCRGQPAMTHEYAKSKVAAEFAVDERGASVAFSYRRSLVPKKEGETA